MSALGVHILFSSSFQRLLLAVYLAAVYEAGRLGASSQEQWWAAGGRGPMMVAACKGAAASNTMKRKRPATEAAHDKENVVQ
jgi:hypothetical protein